MHQNLAIILHQNGKKNSIVLIPDQMVKRKRRATPARSQIILMILIAPAVPASPVKRRTNRLLHRLTVQLMILDDLASPERFTKRRKKKKRPVHLLTSVLTILPFQKNPESHPRRRRSRTDPTTRATAPNPSMRRAENLTLKARADWADRKLRCPGGKCSRRRRRNRCRCRGDDKDKSKATLTMTTSTTPTR